MLLAQRERTQTQFSYRSQTDWWYKVNKQFPNSFSNTEKLNTCKKKKNKITSLQTKSSNSASLHRFCKFVLHHCKAVLLSTAQTNNPSLPFCQELSLRPKTAHHSYLNGSTKGLKMRKNKFLPWAGSGGPNSKEYRRMKLLFHTYSWLSLGL